MKNPNLPVQCRPPQTAAGVIDERFTNDPNTRFRPAAFFEHSRAAMFHSVSVGATMFHLLRCRIFSEEGPFMLHHETLNP
jgi:hypothetical protein